MENRLKCCEVWNLDDGDGDDDDDDDDDYDDNNNNNNNNNNGVSGQHSQYSNSLRAGLSAD